VKSALDDEVPRFNEEARQAGAEAIVVP
jgi:hypothetical protein